MRSSLLILVLALLAAPVIAETPQVPAPLATDTQVALEDLLAPVQTVDPGEACITSASGDALPNWCPFGSPSCVVHDDCDDYCGSPEFGYCDRQGFFPTGCCLCLG